MKKLTEITLPEKIKQQYAIDTETLCLMNKCNEIIDYLHHLEYTFMKHNAETLSPKMEEKTEKALGVGGCCKKCEIYLDYKDDYQCNDGECECHIKDT